MSIRSLCICVDDVGLNEAVNDAAFALLADRRVQALSCLVGAPAWASAAARLRRDTSGPVDLGLHLDLSAHPLTIPPRSWAALWWRGTLSRLSPRVLREEIAAQLERFERHVGRTPDFVDGHHHVHQFPQVRDALLDVLVHRYPGHRPWLRSTRAGRWRPRPLAISRLGGRSLSADAELFAFPQNRRLLGVYDFRGGRERFETLMSDWLRLADHGDLLVCHPAASAAPGDPLGAARADEFAVLGSARFDEALRGEGIRLVSMSRILDEDRGGVFSRR